MIGRPHHVVIDTDPRALAQFYSEMLGLPITYTSDDWVVITEDDSPQASRFWLRSPAAGLAGALPPLSRALGAPAGQFQLQRMPAAESRLAECWRK